MQSREQKEIFVYGGIATHTILSWEGIWLCVSTESGGSSGACLVQIDLGLVYRGPGVVKEIMA